MPPRSPATAGRAGAMIVWSSAPSSITSMSPGSTRTIGARSGPPIGCRLADAWTIGGLPHTNRELSVLYGQHSPADRVAALATVRIGSSPEECGNRRSMDSEPMCQMFDRLVLPEVSGGPPGRQIQAPASSSSTTRSSAHLHRRAWVALVMRPSVFWPRCAVTTDGFGAGRLDRYLVAG